MKRLIVSSIFVALVLSVCGQSADAQLFRRWRRNNNYNNGYYSGYYNRGGTNSYYNGYYRNPAYAVPTYRTGAYQPEVVTTPATPRATTLTPTRPLLGPGETVISGANVRADGTAAAGVVRGLQEPIVPGPAGSTSPNVGATANP